MYYNMNKKTALCNCKMLTVNILFINLGAAG